MFEKTVRDNLLAIADAYRKATGDSMAKIGKKFYGRADFFARLKAGECRISLVQVDAMLKQFKKEWPKKAVWPFTRAIFMDGTR